MRNLIERLIGHFDACPELILYLIDCLHREVERHELYNWPKPGKGGSHSDPGEAHFRDGSVFDSIVSVFLP